MSSVKIGIYKKTNGWTNVYVDGRKIGELEDAEDTVEGTLINLIKAIPIENTEVIILDKEAYKGVK